MRCLNCGKEISKNRKFCSRSCSATYNNKVRERKPWTEEQHRKNKKPEKKVVCKHCGKPGKKICDECKPFVHRVQTYNRLGFLGGSLLERNERLLSFLKQLYFQDNLSLAEIWEKTGLHYRQVEIVFNSAGISLRSTSDGVKNAICTGRMQVSGPLEKKGIRGYHQTWEGKKVWYRSSYELRFAKILDEQRIPYEVESPVVRTRYWDSELQKYRIAVPDFYLPNSKEIIEVKSSYTLGSIQRLKDKFKAYKERGLIPKLWLNFHFVDLDASSM